MHAALYVCLRQSEARTSLQARKKVCKYLHAEGFDLDRRFGGHCDRFKVGGRLSGYLSLLRLKYEQPNEFRKFWRGDETCEQRKRQFREMFPKYRGHLPFGRDCMFKRYGYADDAQIMDEPLFQQLKRGFSEEVRFAWEITDPVVIFTDDPDDDFEWPKTHKEAAKFWVVIIDYHF